MSDLRKLSSASVERETSLDKDEEMACLRCLILGEDYKQVSTMQADLDRVLALHDELGDAAKQAHRIAAVLSEAVLLREQQDRGVSKALRPVIADSIKASVHKDPKPLVDAISPIIGPAIRRAVNEAIAGILQIFDKLLEHSFSWRALNWRFEAWRTGTPYAQVVLFHTLAYWVEEVFLIHRETGLLLQHVTSRQGGIRDPDLIGGMLTAITDFVNDSFNVSSEPEEGSVQSMQVGDHRVTMEQGRLAFIAAVTRGNPPAELTTALQETIETIHILFRDQLEGFDGEAAPFAEARSLLEDCLRSQTKPERKRRPWIASLLLGLLVLGPLGYFSYQSHQRVRVWNTAMDRLRAEPGIVVTDTARDDGLFRVEGLLDPMARDPVEIIGPRAATELQWDWRWKPYLSVEEELVLARARRSLQVPDTVALSVDNGLLELAGEAPQSWVDAMRKAVLRIPGVAAYRDDNLKPSGSSSRDREASAHDSKTLAVRRAELALYREQINAMVFYFGIRSTSLQPDQSHDLDLLAATMKALEVGANELGLVPRYLVAGYADGTGTPTENLRLSLLRARSVIIKLVDRGVSEHLFLPVKLGINPPAKTSGEQEDTEPNRRVTLDVLVLSDAQVPLSSHPGQGKQAITRLSPLNHADNP